MLRPYGIEVGAYMLRPYGIMDKVIKREDMDGALSLEARLSLPDAVAAPVSGRKIIATGDQGDLETASLIIVQAREVAEAIKTRARELLARAEEQVREAREKGFAEGRNEGLAGVTETLTKLRHDNERMLSRLERQALELIFEITQRILGDAFKTSEEAVVGMVRQTLAVAMGNAFTVLVNPADYERVKNSHAKLISGLHGSQVLQLKSAETVRPGCCVIESELGTVEADLALQLKAIRTALGLGDGPDGDSVCGGA